MLPMNQGMTFENLGDIRVTSQRLGRGLPVRYVPTRINLDTYLHHLAQKSLPRATTLVKSPAKIEVPKTTNCFAIGYQRCGILQHQHDSHLVFLNLGQRGCHKIL